MQATNSFKKSFLNHMLLGLQQGGASSTTMSFLERKRAIKLSADVALAIARGGASWSRALLASLAKQEKSKALVRSIIGKEHEWLTGPRSTLRAQRSSKILKRSFRARSRVGKGAPHGVAARVLARRLVKRRIRVLGGLIPGGEALDEFSLLGETTDYIISLRAQVDLMRLLASAVDDPNLK